MRYTKKKLQDNKKQKLSDKEVQEIRALFYSVKQKDIAKKYGISQPQVSAIICHRSRK